MAGDASLAAPSIGVTSIELRSSGALGADSGDCPTVTPAGVRGEAPSRACPTVTLYCDRGEAPAAPTIGGVSLDLLDDLMQLADDGVPVIWPVGVDVAAVRRLLTGRR